MNHHPHSAGVISDAALVSARFAAWLLVNLHPRYLERQPDVEIDSGLRNLHMLVLGYSKGRSQPRLQPLSDRPLTVQDVAAMHRVHEASVRRAIRAGRLAGSLGRYGYEIDPTDARNWQPRKARTAGRAA